MNGWRVVLVLVTAVALGVTSCSRSKSATAMDGGVGVGGAIGAAGTIGTAGASGVAGTTGAGGATGLAGTTGAGGAAGLSGTTGAAGMTAIGGATGAAGTAGHGAGGTTETGAAGTTGDGGAPAADGGVDARPGCTVGAVRCNAAGRRERCAADATWADDDYVCTVALSGSSDYNTMCALKADGRINCWASGDWANAQAARMVTRAPAGVWKAISVGDGAFEICAIATPGKLSCWSALDGAPLPVVPPGATFTSFSYTEYGSCGITTAGGPACFGGVTLPADFVGRFKQIATANFMVYGIDENDQLHAPSFVLPSYPIAKYKQLTANNGASCALREDGAIFCDPVAEMVPAGTGFVEVAATYGNNQACAIRGDGTLVCWPGTTNVSIPPLEAPPTGTFTHLAGCDYAMCGIRSDGSTACWGTPGLDPLVSPAGW